MNAHPDFYAFWADGNPDTLSISRLYFTNKVGNTVCRLPYEMSRDFVRPERLSGGSPAPNAGRESSG